jgi:outer membrane protein OmpA-like peptidoglycan-associated protein
MVKHTFSASGLLLLIGIIVMLGSQTQAQPVLWQKGLGGSFQDMMYSFENTPEGAYICAGFTRSSNVPGLKKGAVDSDMWLLKMSSRGRIIWQKALGGSFSEEGRCVKVTQDGGYVVVGFTDSKELMANKRDFYVVRLDALGNLLWQKAFGGNGDDIAHNVQVLDDGGFMVVGETKSQTGMTNAFKGGIDAWVIRLDKNGNLMWDRNFGGTGNDRYTSIAQVEDGFILLGETDSRDQDIRENRGKLDILLTKIDIFGKPRWHKTLGGSDNDISHGLTNTTDGQLVLVGTTFSSDGMVKNHKGEGDVWLVKVGTEGNVLWERTFGGTGDEGGNNVSVTFNGSLLVAGTTRSDDGDINNRKGLYDGWIFKTDANGNLLWQKTMGGNGKDDFQVIREIPSGDYMVIGNGSSDDGDLENLGNSGGEDAWFVSVRDPLEPPKAISLTPTVLTGYIRNKTTKKFIEAEVSLVNNKSSQRLGSAKSDTIFGIYQIILPDTDAMSIGIVRSGYMFVSQNVRLKPEEKYGEVRLDIELEPIKVGASIKLYNIYFDEAKYEVKPESRVELGRITDFLRANPKVRVLITGHTDGKGDPATKLELSRLRAIAVQRYLIAKGAEGHRLIAKGLGMTKPVADNETEEGRALNRRVEFEIISLE